MVFAVLSVGMSPGSIVPSLPAIISTLSCTSSFWAHRAAPWGVPWSSQKTISTSRPMIPPASLIAAAAIFAAWGTHGCEMALVCTPAMIPILIGPLPPEVPASEPPHPAAASETPASGAMNR
jgi:hypothetical protein